MHIYKHTCFNCRGFVLCSSLWAGCRGTEPSPSHPACSRATQSSLGVGLAVPLRFSACVRLQVYKQKRLSLCFQDCKNIVPL